MSDESPGIDDVDRYINQRFGDTLDLNAQGVKRLRKMIEKNLDFQNRFNEIMDEITEAMAVGMMMWTDLNGDMMLDEMQSWGIDIHKGEDSDDDPDGDSDEGDE